MDGKEETKREQFFTFSQNERHTLIQCNYQVTYMKQTRQYFPPKKSVELVSTGCCKDEMF